MNDTISIYHNISDTIVPYLKYNPDNPILFNQLYFWIFLGLVFAVYSVLYKNIKLRNGFLFAISIFFYYKSSGPFVFLLLFTIIVQYYLGKRIYSLTTDRDKKLLVACSVSVSLLLLSYFKYTSFFIEQINYLFHTNYRSVDYLSIWSNSLFGSKFDITTIILPAGISFFSFHALSYTIDIYRKHTKPTENIIDFGFYLSFFPQLVAGPIIRASEFIPQIYKPYKLYNKEFGLALFLIVGGLIKKMVLSDYLSLNFVDRIFDNPSGYSGVENLFAVYGYALQIYCDFSGYTDIAIGVSLLLGFKIPENFRSPYNALNLTDFWRRWHISLSSWLRDYLYIPLGGNRKGKIRTYLNLLATMLLGGLWHGANWRFVIWGAIHGLGLAIDKMRPHKIIYQNTKWGRIVSIIITFHLVCFAWIFFRATNLNYVWQMLHQIFSNFEAGVLFQWVEGYWKIVTLLVLGFVLHWFPAKYKEQFKNWFIQSSVYTKLVLLFFAVIVIYQFKNPAIQPFIYFQF